MSWFEPLHEGVNVLKGCWKYGASVQPVTAIGSVLNDPDADQLLCDVPQLERTQKEKVVPATSPVKEAVGAELLPDGAVAAVGAIPVVFI